MKNKGLIITLIVLLAIIIAVLVTFLVLCINGTINFNGGFHFGFRKVDTIIYEETYKMDETNLIEVKQKAGDIIFENSNDDNIKVVVYGEDKSDAEVSLANNELKIEYKAEGKGGWLFGWGRTQGDVKIYIPTSYAKNIKINDDAGDIKLANLENSNVDIDCNAGDVKIDRVKNLTAKCDAGNIEINNLLNKCNIKLNAGNLKIENTQINEDSNIKANMGNVKIRGLNDIYVDAKADLGNCKVQKSNRSSNVTLKIECNMGNVKVE